MGTRPDQTVYCTPEKDHPHACGDKLLASPDIPDIAGSSPRVWGQEVSGITAATVARIIPTRVGTSVISDTRNGGCWDHPHACGDKSDVGYADVVQVGSSPRVWGQVLKKGADITAERIIPTRVGTSWQDRIKIQLKQDHPHACGDKSRCLAFGQ